MTEGLISVALRRKRLGWTHEFQNFCKVFFKQIQHFPNEWCRLVKYKKSWSISLTQHRARHKNWWPTYEPRFRGQLYRLQRTGRIKFWEGAKETEWLFLILRCFLERLNFSSLKNKWNLFVRKSLLNEKSESSGAHSTIQARLTKAYRDSNPRHNNVQNTKVTVKKGKVLMSTPYSVVLLEKIN